MNVICGRCETEYEFDDALVSERGTTVKCTNCGFQFRVQQSRAGHRAQPERWLVRQPSGTELVFSSLGELQRAIAAQQVHLADSLSKDGHDYRPIRDVAELVPFFHGALKSAAPGGHKSTLIGMAQGPFDSGSMDTVERLAAKVIEPAVKKRSEPPPYPPRTPLGGVGPAENSVDVYVPPSGRVPQFAAVDENDTASAVGPPATPPPVLDLDDPRTRPMSSDVPTQRAEVLSERAAPKPEAPIPPAAPAPNADGIDRRDRQAPPADMASTQVSRGSEPSGHSDSEPPSSRRSPRSVIPAPIVAPPPRRRAGRMRWVVALVLLGGGVLLLKTVGKGYLSQFTSQESSLLKADARVQALLSAGEQHIVSGDLEAAKAEFDKASVLAESHAGVLLGLARIEAVRADRVWLKQYLLPKDAAAAIESANNELRVRTAKLGAALDAAVAVAPEDSRTVLLEIDFKRIQGNPGAARALIARLKTDASDPGTAYVLAALDVAESAPVWSTVLLRLRTAMASDRGLGRAQALLIVALAESGDITAAEKELEKLRALESMHALSELLSAFVKRVPEQVPAAESPAAGASGASAAASGSAETAAVSDFRGALDAAVAARRTGDLGRSEALLERALQLEPGNVEATAGLGDLAKRRGQLSKARSYFEAVLTRNPDYIPAVVGLADIKWADGDRAGAVTLYERVAAGTVYYEHARRRVDQAARGIAKGDLPTPPADEPNNTAQISAPAQQAVPESEDLPSAPKIKTADPYIDTTDLPQ